MSDSSTKANSGSGLFVKRSFSAKPQILGPDSSKQSTSTTTSPRISPSSSVNSANVKPVTPNVTLTTPNFEKLSFGYFDGLLDLERVLEHWSKKLTMYVSSSEVECQFNLWSGPTLTGKTTIAKRLAGLEGFKAFEVQNSKVRYYDCYTLKDNFDKLKAEWGDVQSTPHNTVIFIDEFEKCVDATHKLVDSVFAGKLQKFFEDIKKTQKIMFIFLTDQKNDRATVNKLLDAKLTSITDFSLLFPDWTPQRLAALIIKKLMVKKIKITDEAAANLALHAMEHTKYMEVQGVIPLLEAELRVSGKSEIDVELMESVLKGRR